jgi:hypothetical protein
VEAKEAKVLARQQAAAATLQANAWHKGYTGPFGDNLDIYFRWRKDLSCAAYALNGCWRIEVITSHGCSYLEVDSNEMQGGAIIGSLLANQTNVPPKTPVLFELDADTSGSGVTASAPSFTCDHY